MGKRSRFDRRPSESYQTPYSGFMPLLPHLHGVRTFAEPCAGEGKLIRWAERHGLECGYRGDIIEGQDAMTVPLELYAFDAIITNPPWRRDLLHPMIERFMRFAPTWLLFEADWAFTRQAHPFIANCSHIVVVGRLKWIPGSEHTGMESVAWYRFHAQHVDGPRLIPARPEKASHVEPDDQPNAERTFA